MPVFQKSVRLSYMREQPVLYTTTTGSEPDMCNLFVPVISVTDYHHSRTDNDEGYGDSRQDKGEAPHSSMLGAQ